MFSKKITNSDEFLELPTSSQCLYFHLSMNADDDGFLNNWKSIIRMVGCKDDDMKILIAKRFIIPFDSGVIVIKHWRVNNYLRNDRYTTTEYQKELGQLSLSQSSGYELVEDTNVIGIPLVYPDKIRIEKTREDKIREKEINKEKENEKRFVKPSIEEIHAYCDARNNGISGQLFFDFYESNGWKVGKNPMKNWQAAVRTWEQQRKTTGSTPNKNIQTYDYSKKKI